MRKILITNNKGGCGKSTLATNLAAYFANEGVTTSLADYDEQGSSVEWLDRRSDKVPKISALIENIIEDTSGKQDVVIRNCKNLGLMYYYDYILENNLSLSDEISKCIK